MAKKCSVCDKDGAAYKCPTCKVPYCSVNCCKTHKTSGCTPPEPQRTNEVSQGESVKNYDFPTEDTVPIEKLEQLRHSEEYKKCLQNPHVRQIMKAVISDPNPTRAIALAMTEPIFVEMADACLKVVEPPDEEKPC